MVHLRSFKPLNVAFPAPGIYRKVVLVLPDLEPSVLSRLSESGSEPLSLILDFEQDISARSLLNFITENLEELQGYHAGYASPLHRSIFSRLHLSTNRERMGKLIAVENPLEAPQD